MVLVTALSLLVIATMPASAQIINVTVSIDNITLAPQATAIIPITITEADKNVSSAQINLTYDPAVVQIIDVGNSDFDNFDHNIINGEVKMAGYQGSSPSLVPPIKFANVTIKAIGNPGDCTPLNLELGAIMSHGSSFHNQLPNNGSVCIVVGVPVYNTFGMIALIGLLAIVLAVAVRKR